MNTLRTNDSQIPDKTDIGVVPVGTSESLSTADGLLSEMQGLPNMPNGAQLIRATEICVLLNKAAGKHTDQDVLEQEIFQSMDYFSQQSSSKKSIRVGSLAAAENWSIHIKQQASGTDISLRRDSKGGKDAGQATYKKTQIRLGEDGLIQGVRESDSRPIDEKEFDNTPGKLEYGKSYLMNTAMTYLRMMANDLHRQLLVKEKLN